MSKNLFARYDLLKTDTVVCNKHRADTHCSAYLATLLVNKLYHIHDAGKEQLDPVRYFQNMFDAAVAYTDRDTYIRARFHQKHHSHALCSICPFLSTLSHVHVAAWQSLKRESCTGVITRMHWPIQYLSNINIQRNCQCDKESYIEWSCPNIPEQVQYCNTPARIS